MYGVLGKMFRAKGHSPGGPDKGRESSAPLPALTTIYVVSTKMLLDERKSFPKPKVTILGFKLPHHKPCNSLLYTKVTLTEKSKDSFYLLLSMAVAVFTC